MPSLVWYRKYVPHSIAIPIVWIIILRYTRDEYVARVNFLVYEINGFFIYQKPLECNIRSVFHSRSSTYTVRVVRVSFFTFFFLLLTKHRFFFYLFSIKQHFVDPFERSARFYTDIFRRNIILVTRAHNKRNVVLETSMIFFWNFSIQFQYKQRTYVQIYT